MWRTLPQRQEAEQIVTEQRFPEEPEENLLYFIEKNAPLLEPWQREIVRIVRKIGQYFYPQRQTQVMNEGWATFWHYTLLNTLYDVITSYSIHYTKLYEQMRRMSVHMAKPRAYGLMPE